MEDKLTAIKTKKFIKERNSMNAYIKFMESEAVEKAIQSVQGSLFMDHHLRLDFCDRPESVIPICEYYMTQL